jgi:hypothetical protein
MHMAFSTGFVLRAAGPGLLPVPQLRHDWRVSRPRACSTHAAACRRPAARPSAWRRVGKRPVRGGVAEYREALAGPVLQEKWFYIASRYLPRFIVVDKPPCLCSATERQISCHLVISWDAWFPSETSYKYLS